MYNKGLIKKYFELLPVNNNTPIVTLNEGDTPLIELINFTKEYQKLALRVFVKFEGLNPTGSFKDRGMTLAISKAKEDGAKAVICASTGNTSAAAAAYAARAGMKCFVILPEGKIAKGKLAQAIIHGAKIIQISGNFDDGMQMVKKISEELDIILVNSVNPYRIEGQKTASFEIIDELGFAPDYHCIPVGNACNIAAYWQGYKEYYKLGKCKKLPQMLGFQAKGAAPLVNNEFVDDPETIATAIRIGKPQSFDKAKIAVKESNGDFMAITDEEILSAQKMLSATEGIFAEPASNAAIAGLIKMLEQDKIKSKSTIVCTLTGHGLKDADIAVKDFNANNMEILSKYDDIKNIIKKEL